MNILVMGGVFATLIPPFQNMPPAGHEDTFAYRFACHQLISRDYGDRTEWGVRKEGEFYPLHELPSIPESEAHSQLNSAGICKVGSEADGVIEVPAISPQQAKSSEIEVLLSSQDTPPYLLFALIGAGMTMVVIALVTPKKESSLDNYLKGLDEHLGE